MRFTGIRRPEEFRVVTRAHVIAWRDELAQRGLGGSTVRHRLSALAALFEYLCDKNAVAHNPAKGVERPKSESGEGKTPAIADHQARCSRPRRTTRFAASATAPYKTWRRSRPWGRTPHGCHRRIGPTLGNRLSVRKPCELGMSLCGPIQSAYFRSLSSHSDKYEYVGKQKYKFGRKEQRPLTQQSIWH
jgi:hypothetical protein